MFSIQKNYTRFIIFLLFFFCGVFPVHLRPRRLSIAAASVSPAPVDPPPEVAAAAAAAAAAVIVAAANAAAAAAAAAAATPAPAPAPGQAAPAPAPPASATTAAPPASATVTTAAAPAAAQPPPVPSSYTPIITPINNKLECPYHYNVMLYSLFIYCPNLFPLSFLFFLALGEFKKLIEYIRFYYPLLEVIGGIFYTSRSFS